TPAIENRGCLVSRIMISVRHAPGSGRGSRVSPHRRVWTSGSNAGRAETAFLPAAGLFELRDHGKFRPGRACEHELGDAVAGPDQNAVNPGRRGFGPDGVSIPRRDQAGTSVIGVDQPDRIAEHQPLAMTETGARQ